MKKNKRRSDYGMLGILMITCIGLWVVLLQAVIGKENIIHTGDSAGTLGTSQNIQLSEEIKLSEEKLNLSEEETKLSEAKTEQSEEEKMAEEMVTEGGRIMEIPILPAITIIEPEIYEFTVSDRTYFDDALFIGDSRTLGLKEYGTLDNADYFASAGLNLYTIGKTKMKLEDEQKISLEEMLSQNTYGKIYVMLGINELGYDFDTTVSKYQQFLEYLDTMQPGAILYVCANLHVNSLRNEVDQIHNNEAINRMNRSIEAFADQKDIFYLDVNPLFDDEEGNLAEEYISDDSHLLGKYYEVWCDWYCENTIVKRMQEVQTETAANAASLPH